MFCENCGQKQTSDNNKFCENCGQPIIVFTKTETPKKVWYKNKSLIIISSVIFVLILIYLASPPAPEESSGGDTTTPITNSNDSPIKISQEELITSVVNILCPLAEEGLTLDSEDGSGGSGTIISPDGIIMTNNHVIPQDAEFLHTPEEGCFVLIPEAKTGRPAEIYLAQPIVLPEVSEEYDIAFLQIYDVFVDEEGTIYGEYPRNFSDRDICENPDVRLGEPIRIFGYPMMSGGISLTITDGIVSSFPEEGLISTSAKIDSGNSGGLAVDQNGCMIGIPSAVNIGNYENMGVVLSLNLISEFLEKMTAYLEANQE